MQSLATIVRERVALAAAQLAESTNSPVHQNEDRSTANSEDQRKSWNDRRQAANIHSNEHFDRKGAVLRPRQQQRHRDVVERQDEREGAGRHDGGLELWQHDSPEPTHRRSAEDITAPLESSIESGYAARECPVGKRHTDDQVTD